MESLRLLRKKQMATLSSMSHKYYGSTLAAGGPRILSEFSAVVLDLLYRHRRVYAYASTFIYFLLIDTSDGQDCHRQHTDTVVITSQDSHRIGLHKLSVGNLIRAFNDVHPSHTHFFPGTSSPVNHHDTITESNGACHDSNFSCYQHIGGCALNHHSMFTYSLNLKKLFILWNPGISGHTST